MCAYNLSFILCLYVTGSTVNSRDTGATEGCPRSPEVCPGVRERLDHYVAGNTERAIQFPALSFCRGLDLLQDGENCSTATGQDPVTDQDREREPATVDELYDLKHYDSSGEEDGAAMCMIPIPL